MAVGTNAGGVGAVALAVGEAPTLAGHASWVDGTVMVAMAVNVMVAEAVMVAEVVMVAAVAVG